MSYPIIACISRIEVIGKKKKDSSGKILQFPTPPPHSDRQFLLEGTKNNILITLSKPEILPAKKRIREAKR